MIRRTLLGLRLRLRVVLQVLTENWALVIGALLILLSLPADSLNLNWLGMAAGVASIALAVVDISQRVAVNRSIEFSERPGDDYLDVVQALRDNERFVVRDAGIDIFVEDRALGRRLASGSVAASLSDRRYRIPPELATYGRLFGRRWALKAWPFNGKVLGLGSDIGVAEADTVSAVRMVASDYLAYMSTDVFASQNTKLDGRLRAGLGRELFVRRGGRLRDFGDSWLLNAVGISVLALTTDMRVVVVDQSKLNDAAGGLKAPSGSGSLEPRDFRNAASLGLDVLAANGALREMQEETGIREDQHVDSVHSLGFGRLLRKGGKPEVLCVAFLKIDSHAVARIPRPAADRKYTAAVNCYRFDGPVAAWSTSVPPDLQGMLSAQLALSLDLISEAAADELSVLGALLRDRHAKALS